MDEISEAEAILSRVESKNRSFRGAFCFALVGLVTLVAASVRWAVPDVIRAKTLHVMDGDNVVATASIYEHKIIMGTLKGDKSLVSVGESSSGSGVIALSAMNEENVLKLWTTKGGGGSISINSAQGKEIANASPNVTNAGSLFIDNSASGLIGELNGDKQNGGAIILHDATGTETARVHQ